jgi:hypothetical protein
VRRLRTWPLCRDQEWTRRPGASPPMRMTASWSRSPRIDRIQVCGATDRANGELPSDQHADADKSRSLQGLWVCGRSASPTGSASPLPEQARKAGKCSPSPTYPQAPRPQRKLISMGTFARGFACAPKSVFHLTSNAPYKSGHDDCNEGRRPNLQPENFPRRAPVQGWGWGYRPSEVSCGCAGSDLPQGSHASEAIL